MKKQNTSIKKMFYKVIFTISLLIFIFCAVILIKFILPEKDTMSQFHNTTTTEGTTASEIETVTTIKENPIDFIKLHKITKDVYAWIQIPGTSIDYAVAQSSPDKDDLFYLNHNIEGNYEFAGTIFSQKANSLDFNDPVTFLYGHNMLNGSMFHDLLKFEDAKFFKKHEEFYIYTPGHILTYKIVSAFVYDDRHIMNTFNFLSKEDHQEYIDTVNAPKSIEANVRDNFSADLNSKIVTLSTCTNIKSQRYLLQGVLINDEQTN